MDARAALLSHDHKSDESDMLEDNDDIVDDVKADSVVAVVAADVSDSTFKPAVASSNTPPAHHRKQLPQEAVTLSPSNELTSGRKPLPLHSASQPPAASSLLFPSNRKLLEVSFPSFSPRATSVPIPPAVVLVPQSQLYQFERKGFQSLASSAKFALHIHMVCANSFSCVRVRCVNVRVQCACTV